MGTKISSSISSLYERQIGWLEAREKKMLSTTAVLRSKDSIDHTFNPKRPDKSTRCMFTSTLKESHQGSPQKKCGLIAHESHVRRYAKARADKKRQTAALTWSAFRREASSPFNIELDLLSCREGMMALELRKHRHQNARLCMRDFEDVHSEGDDLDQEESFFMQLQRERKQWDKEQSKLMTVIELQQHELHARGRKVEDRACKIAQSFAESIASFEDRFAKVEQDLVAELSNIKVVAERLDSTRQPFILILEDRLRNMEIAVRAMSAKLDAALC